MIFQTTLSSQITNMAARMISYVDDINEANMCIRDVQKTRAYAFPSSFAPNGRLKETTPNHYMKAMNLYYEYEKTSEDLTLELKQFREGEPPVRYAPVGVPVVQEGEVEAECHLHRTEQCRCH